MAMPVARLVGSGDGSFTTTLRGPVALASK
jgi:hypothetical protein